MRPDFTTWKRELAALDHVLDLVCLKYKGDTLKLATLAKDLCRAQFINHLIYQTVRSQHAATPQISEASLIGIARSQFTLAGQALSSLGHEMAPDTSDYETMQIMVMDALAS